VDGEVHGDGDFFEEKSSGFGEVADQGGVGLPGPVHVISDGDVDEEDFSWGTSEDLFRNRSYLSFSLVPVTFACCS